MVYLPVVKPDHYAASIGLTGPESGFRQTKVRKSAAFLQQELADCRVLGQADSPVEGVKSLAQFSESLQEVGANGPIGLIIRYGSELNFIQCCQPGTGPFRFGKGGSVSGARAQRREYTDELLIEQHDRSPLGSTAARSLRMHRLDRGFKLKAAGASLLRCLGKMAFRLFNEGKQPLPRVLL